MLKKLGGCGCVPQSGFPALVPKAPGVIRGRAPSAVRCEFFFCRSWGTVRLVPRRHRPPQLGFPKSGPTAGADGPKQRPTPCQFVGQLCQIEPTAKLANFRDAKIQRKAHDESKGGSRARARSRSKGIYFKFQGKAKLKPSRSALFGQSNPPATAA